MTRRRYAVCQAAGWSAWAVMTVAYFQLSGVGSTLVGVRTALIISALGVGISHGYRSLVRAWRWTQSVRPAAAMSPSTSTGGSPSR